MQISINELINYCFVDVALGLDKESNVIVTQAQVQELSNLCDSIQPDSWDNVGINNPKASNCCMRATVGGGGMGATSSKVVIRRDILLAAGCRATANSVNNVSPTFRARAETPFHKPALGDPCRATARARAHTPMQGDGKMHRPRDIIPEGVFQGIVNLDSSPPPFNFDYPSVLENLQRTSMDDPGFNKVCLLPQAYEEVAGAECALLTQRDTESVAPDKKRTLFEDYVRYDDAGFPYFYFAEGFVETPWQVSAVERSGGRRD